MSIGSYSNGQKPQIFRSGSRLKFYLSINLDILSPDQARREHTINKRRERRSRPAW
jgi:hypothetical protein